MLIAPYQVTAPALTGESCNQSEALGSATWLWMQSERHRQAPIYALSSLLLPAIQQGRFVLVSTRGKPVLYMSWANFSVAAERRYLDHPPGNMPQTDWNSGPRLWCLDWIAPFGHTRALTRLIRTWLMPDQVVRALYHQGASRGLRVISWHGINLSRQQMRAWLQSHPLASPGSSDE